MLQSVASRSSQQSGSAGVGAGSPSGCAEELEDLRAQLREERAHRREIEKEMEMQVGDWCAGSGGGGTGGYCHKILEWRLRYVEEMLVTGGYYRCRLALNPQ